MRIKHPVKGIDALCSHQRSVEGSKGLSIAMLCALCEVSSVSLPRDTTSQPYSLAHGVSDTPSSIVHKAPGCVKLNGVQGNEASVASTSRQLAMNRGGASSRCSRRWWLGESIERSFPMGSANDCALHVWTGIVLMQGPHGPQHRVGAWHIFDQIVDLESPLGSRSSRISSAHPFTIRVEARRRSSSALM